MFRGYRGIILAFGLILSGTDHAYGEGSSQQPNPQHSIAKSLDDIATAYRQETERAQGTDKQTEPCQPGDDRRYSDLCAQWKAADAASDSAWWAWAAGVASIVGLLGVAVALGLTVWSNVIMRDSARRQLRAYMEVSECTIRLFPEHGEIIMQIRLENCGQTPAQNASVMAESFVGPFPLQNEYNFTRIDEDGWTLPVGPGKCISCAKRLYTEDVDLAVEEAKSRRGAFYIQGICEYTDAFGIRHETAFRYGFAGIVSDKGLVMQAARTGNYST